MRQPPISKTFCCKRKSTAKGFWLWDESRHQSTASASASSMASSSRILARSMASSVSKGFLCAWWELSGLSELLTELCKLSSSAEWSECRCVKSVLWCASGSLLESALAVDPIDPSLMALAQTLAILNSASRLCAANWHKSSWARARWAEDAEDCTCWTLIAEATPEEIEWNSVWKSVGAPAVSHLPSQSDVRQSRVRWTHIPLGTCVSCVICGSWAMWVDSENSGSPGDLGPGDLSLSALSLSALSALSANGHLGTPNGRPKRPQEVG